MRQERLYVLVGLFVGGAISLSILLALYIYDEYLHEKVETYVMFFRGSLSGIQVSSDVTYRGVKIGEVKHIEITEDTISNKIRIPVYVQFFVDRNFVGKQNPIQALVGKGYVANIKKPNFLTGVASIDLMKGVSSYPNKGVNYNGYPIFPTTIKAEENTNLDDAFASAKQAFQDISSFIQSARVNGVLDATKSMAVTVESMVKNLNHIIPPTLNSMNMMVKTIDKLVPPTLVSFTQSLKQFSVLTTNLEQLVPPALATFTESMKEVSDAANSTQNLMDYLQRYPESLIRGKR
ncbi:MAG: MCE family protein [Tatlockia sp.]|nr:MCE family protein [Tatlockia sp.]